MPATLSPSPPLELNSPDLIRRVNDLRTIDNHTNWLYMVREWLILGGIIALTILFYDYRETWELAWVWNVPVTLLAIIIIGGCQHRLTNLGHEASHYMLFRNRLLNELASDWLCMFPMLSCTHHYRLQHLAHHQYVNDPERDPDVFQMSESGHRYEFPMARGRFLWECVLKQLLWFPKLIRYIRVRAKYNATGAGKGPYQIKGSKTKTLVLAGILYLLSLVGTLTGLVWYGDPILLAVVPAVMLAAALAFYALVPAGMYLKSLVKPDVPPRYMTLMRITFLTCLFTTVAWLTYLTDRPWWLYYFVLWVAPLFTTFSFFMILRQLVQHGNASSDRLTNTRIFRVNRLIQVAVFPLGMDWHLPHHMFPMVPHYRLQELHELLMETEAYRQQAVVVEGYFLHREQPPKHPTVLDLMAEARK
jgi:fatty acid desaturase